MKGSLSDRCTAEVLSEVQRRQISGTLSLAHGAISRQLFIDAGTTIRFAASNHPSESFTAHLVEKAGLDDVQLRAATSAKQPDELMGTTLVRLGLLTADQFATLTREHIERVLHAALAMNEGDWEFQSGALPFREQMDAGLRTTEVLLEWSRGLTDATWTRGRLGSDDVRIQRNPRPPEAYQTIRLDAAEGYIMSRVDGKATLREIGMVSPMGDARTLAALLGLALAGILESPPGREFAGRDESDLGEEPVDRSAGLPFPERATATNQVAWPPAVAAPSIVAAPPAAVAVAQPATAAAPPAATATAPVATPPLRLVTPGAAPAASAPRPGTAARAGTPVKRPPSRFGMGQRRPGTAHGAAGGAPRRVPPPAPKPPPPQALPESSGDLETDMQTRYDQLDAQNLYQVLGVNPVASRDDIRRAYYALARRFHPDRFRREEIKPRAEKVFARITEAYATLFDPETRQRYDGEEAGRMDARASDRPADTTELARQNYRTGREHFERGRLAEALGFLANACQQDPTRPEYFELLGITQSRNPRLRKEAEASLLKAIDLAPASASAHAHLGTLYERSGAVDKAREMFRKALQWDPENAIALKGLGEDEPARKGLFGLFTRR